MARKSETKRLEELCSYDVMDTGLEEGFDRITRLAQLVFDVPIAFISLVDAERQWFKSRQGLKPTETPRKISFCTHVIESNQPIVVKDARMDSRFCHNPLVTGDPYVRFYSGAPLTSPRGYNLGTLCLIDTKPRKLTPEQLNCLSDMALMVISELELRKLTVNDPVTGAFSRIEFRRVLDTQIATARVESKPFSMIIIGIDRFSWMNSTFGYDVGNFVLKNVAELCETVFETPSIVARYSGKQFAVILPHMNLAEAAGKAEDLRVKIADFPFEHNCKKFDATASIGVAEFSPRRDTSELLLTRVLLRLEAAKRAGRNQIVDRDVVDESTKVA